MLIVGLTGGIGSGKSTVSSMLFARGAVPIDVDGLGRAVIAPDGRAEAEVLAAFGDQVADADGYIDRAALARLVFGRPEELARLTAISHPAINLELADMIRAQDRDAIVVLDMAILVESNLGRGDPVHSYSKVVVVEAPIELRIARAVARGMTEADVRARIASQATDAERRAVADAVITNDGDFERLDERVEQLWQTMLAWAEER